MRNKTILLFLFSIISLNSFCQNKKALIIAIGQYAARSVIPIASVNDIKYIKAALEKNGFKNNIETLVNAQATKSGIIKKLNTLAASVKKNDIVVIHFACHGQQIRDQRTIELGKDEEDGYDESLLPYDARGDYSPGKYEGEKHLRDDELGPLLDAIRKNIGKDGSLLVLLDACHSGTGTRADDFPASRGEPVPFPDPENPYNPSSLMGINENETFFDYNSDSLSNMVVISGSGPQQVNKQMVVNYEEVGSLSYAFYKAINELPAESDYNLLFQKIKATIQAAIPEQVPMIEGDRNQIIFSGKYFPKEERNYIRVGVKEFSQLKEDSLFILNRGMIDNLKAGIKGKIYEAGNNILIATALIQKTEHFRSIGVANKLLKKSIAYEFRPDEENNGNLLTLISFDKKNSSPPAEKQIKETIGKYQFVKIAQSGDLQFKKGDEENNNKLLLQDRNNKVLWSGLINENGLIHNDDITRLSAAIKNDLRIRYLRQMPDGGSLLPEISAEIISRNKSSKNENLLLKEGDSLKLKIINNSNQDLFYSVLDIYPDNRVNVVYKKNPANYRVQKNNFIERSFNISKDSPPGIEFFKIILSVEPMDIYSVFEHKSDRNNMQSFQKVLDDLFHDENSKTSTRADVSSIKAEEVGIISIQFTVRNN